MGEEVKIGWTSSWTEQTNTFKKKVIFFIFFFFSYELPHGNVDHNRKREEFIGREKFDLCNLYTSNISLMTLRIYWFQKEKKKKPYCISARHHVPGVHITMPRHQSHTSDQPKHKICTTPLLLHSEVFEHAALKRKKKKNELREKRGLSQLLV